MKHSITPSFAEDTGFDVSRAAAAHAEVARSKLKDEAAFSHPGAEGEECTGVHMDVAVSFLSSTEAAGYTPRKFLAM